MPTADKTAYVTRQHVAVSLETKMETWNEPSAAPIASAKQHYAQPDGRAFLTRQPDAHHRILKELICNV